MKAKGFESMTKKSRKPVSPFELTLGALYIAMFALAGNIPILSSIQLIPGVPVTLQIFLVAMMGLTLGVRGGMTTYLALLVLTFCGVPLMSGGRGGPAVFVGPTCGYIYGWFFLILLLGMYSTLAMDKLIGKKVLGMSIHVPVSFAVGMAGLLLVYACGSLGVAAAGGQPLTKVPALLLSNIAFLPADAVKIAGASLLSLSLFAKPALKQFFRGKKLRA